MNMNNVTKDDVKRLYTPPRESHKGQNGRLLIIGGSELFHAASTWALMVASRIVDLVHYASVPQNNELIQRAKEEFRNGIIVPRGELESYIEEDDCILIGPGMVRTQVSGFKNQDSKIKNRSLDEILYIENEGEMTGVLTKYLLTKYPNKQWVIDAGALQMVDIGVIPKNAILTPHQGELEGLWEKISSFAKASEDGQDSTQENHTSTEDKAQYIARTIGCIVLVKGVVDIACGPAGECREIHGGNAGMTKGGTGDVLAGLIAALACKNNPFLATIAGSYINKLAGDKLHETMGPYFNATDLANQIPETMNTILNPQ